jgi:hypothetical protein
MTLRQVMVSGNIADLPTVTRLIFAPADIKITPSEDGFTIQQPRNHVLDRPLKHVVVIENNSIVIEFASVAMIHFHDFGEILYKKTLRGFEAFVVPLV